MPKSRSLILHILTIISLLLSIQSQAVEKASENTSIEAEAKETADDEVSLLANETKSTEKTGNATTKDKPSGKAQVLQQLEQRFKTLKPQEVLRLQDEEGDFFALLATERLGKTKGAVLILPDKGQHAGWPDNLLTLHEELADHGWISLFISLPEPLPPVVPKRSSKPKPAPSKTSESDQQNTDGKETTEKNIETSKPEETTAQAEQDEIDKPVTDTDDESNSNNNNAKDAETETGSEQQKKQDKPQEAATPSPEKQLSREELERRHKQQIQTRIQAGIQHLQQQGQFNLALVAEGHSAPAAINYANQAPRASKNNEVDTIQALILINAKTSKDGKFETLLVEQAIPTMDLNSANSPGSQRAIQQRQTIIPRSARGQWYFPVNIPAIQSRQISLNSPVTERIARRVRGWLDRNLEGQEIKANLQK